MNILIVDDEINVVLVLRDFLCDRGYRVDVAGDGKEAMALIKARHYDVVITDHDMPEMTGVELVRQIRGMNEKIKIIMISGYPNMEGFVAKSIGAHEYLTKPVSLEALNRALDALTGDQDA